MSKVKITLEDSDGLVQCGWDFGAGFSEDSGAHRTARMLMQHMDSVCESKDGVPNPAQAAEPAPQEPARILLPN